MLDCLNSDLILCAYLCIHTYLLMECWLQEPQSGPVILPDAVSAPAAVSAVAEATKRSYGVSGCFPAAA